jgi:putative pyoverdin transport system ATP-binding/permease protein
MSFLQLVRREIQGSIPRLVFMSVLGGVSNAAILASINAGSQGQTNHSSSLWSSALFILSLLLFVKAQHYVNVTWAVEIEAIIHRLRVRLMDAVRHSELMSIEKIGRSRIVGTITSDTAILKQMSRPLVFSLQGLVLIVFVAFYIAYLSLAAFLLSAAIIGIAAVILHHKNLVLKHWNELAEDWSNQLFDRLGDLLNGFKEVRLNEARSGALVEDAGEVSRTAANIKIWSDAETLKQMITTQTLVYLLLGTVVFAVPLFGDSLANSTAEATTALLFVVGSCFALVQSIPLLMAADAAADRLDQLEADLRVTHVSVEAGVLPHSSGFSSIEMRDIVFKYIDKSSEALFQVGPVDFVLRSGELVFITGGNGSGKSTFLKLLAGLFIPDSGSIELDGERVDNSTREHFRSLMSAIFTDYHLFKRLYGISDSDPAELDRLLRQFQLNKKTHLTDGEFVTLDLSGGQRKRLALVVGLLEKRPILLLDEWTSDQDPEFRRYFYDTLLPVMNAAGKTIVVVTHDDRYLDSFNLPARRFRMDEGRFIEQSSV